MAGEGDAKARFPRQDVNEGQKHGYLGDVDVFEPDAPGSSNADTAADRAAGRAANAKGKKTESGGTVDVVTPADAGEPETVA